MDDPYGLPAVSLAQAAGVSLDTARRWKRQHRIPPQAARLVALWLRGDLGAIDPAWRGFTVRSDGLWTPYGFCVRPGEISGIPYRFAQLAALELECKQPRQWELFR